MTEPNIIKNSKLQLTFCARGIEPPKATAEHLPILVDSCPEKFSTVDYFIVSQNDVTDSISIVNFLKTFSRH